MAVVWPLVLVAVFFPLSVRGYRRARQLVWTEMN